MKRKLQLLGIALFIVSVASAQAVGDQLTVDNVYYTITGLAPNTVSAGDVNESATSGTAAAVTDLVIPATITSGGNTYDVTSLALKAFAGNTDIVTVDLSALSITSLPQQAFYGNATYTCKLKTVILPSSVTTLGQACFQNQPLITSMNTGNLTDLSARNALAYLGLTSVDFSKVTTIGRQSFRQIAGITSLDLPAITSLGQDAFNGLTSLTTLKIGAGLTSLNATALNSLPALTSLYWAVPEATLNVTPVLTASTLANVTLYVRSEEAKTAYAASWGASFKEIIVDPSLSSNKQEKSVDFNVYPNPTSGTVFIKSNDVENAALTVYDLNGREVLNKKISGSDSEINLSNQASGIYLVKVKSANSETVKRIVKQ